ncbi:MAG: zinc-binding dehydrogenase, partial [Anaerolineae bacterium]|nr:zinc-binding dehydrogenase [Anaerolineae bacterium]
DYVIDYTQADFTKNGQTYDVIIDVVGKRLFSRRLKSLKENGYYFLANAGLSHLILKIWISLTSSKKVIIAAASQKREDLIYLKELIESGKLKTVIDRSYPLEEIPEAHRYVETGQKKGNVVILIEHNN